MRHYFRRHGYKRVPLPGLPGSSEFMAAYAAALDGETAPRIEIGASGTKPGSIGAAIANYLASADFNDLAIDTRKDRRRLLDRFREAHGGKPLARLESRHVEQILAAKAAVPNAARNLLMALQAMIKVSLRAGLCTVDPTAGIRREARISADGFHTWTEADVAQFKAHWLIGTRERLAFGLLLCTGQRRSDIVRMGPSTSKAASLWCAKPRLTPSW
jgi:integrase